jgi:hypothetical protein
LYLAADRALIGDLSEELGVDGGADVALGEFHRACLTLLDREAAHATVRDATFRKVSGTAGSCAICLAVQQVLVVERMLKDSKFTAHSYFPRYRAALELKDTTSRSNPLRGSGFQDIWDTLARDIRSVAGAGRHTITFERGEGPELNRRLPISQALLSAHDLAFVLENAPRLRGVTEQRRILGALNDLRSALGKRARLLLATASGNGDMASRICAQVIAFFEWDAAVLSDLEPRPTSAERPGTLVAYLERADPFSWDVDADRFSVYLRVENEQLKGEALSAAIGDRLSRQGCVILASAGDAYWEIRGREDVGENEALLAITEAWCADRFVGMVTTQYHADFIRAASNLPESYVALLCNAGGSELVGKILVRPAGGRRVELQGGLMVDARTHRYLVGYAPTALVRQGVKLLDGTDVVVNGSHMNLRKFFEDIGQERGAKTYLLQLGRDVIECAVVEARPETAGRRAIGYQMRKGRLAPVASEFDPNATGLCGTLFVGGVVDSCLSEQDIALLVNDGARLAVPERVVRALLDELRLLGEGNLRANLAARRVAGSKSVPVVALAVGLLKRLAARGAEGDA